MPHLARNSPRLRREDKSRARGSRFLLCTDVQCSQQPHYSLPNARLPAVHATCKLGLGLSPSRQTVIRYNDSTGIRCYVRPYSPHYAPSLVLSNVPYFRPVCSVDSPSPNLLTTYRRKKLDYSELQPAALLEPQLTLRAVRVECRDQPRRCAARVVLLEAPERVPRPVHAQ